MTIGDTRIITQVVSGPEIGPDIQPVFIGHCEVANPDAVFEDPQLTLRLQEMGYAERIAVLGADDGLYELPLPIRSLAQFQRLFPASPRQLETDPGDDVEQGETHQQDSGENWLPWAVRDFFAAAIEQSDDRICWVIRVRKTTGETEIDDIDRFDINPSAVRHEPLSWNAVELACSIETAGMLVMPDFEKLLVPRAIVDVARNQLPNPAPSFHPCGTLYDDGHRERRYSSEMPDYKQIDDADERIRRIAWRLHAWRPDMQWLLSLPPEIDNGIALSRPVSQIADWLESRGEDAPELAHVQFLFPLVYGDERPLTSASGVLAGHIVHKTRTEGVWRSVAGMPLASHLSPWPEIGTKQRSRLREKPGIGVLHPVGSKLQLDDERLVASGFCDHAGSACRSGELMRFVGWLRRSLRDLGEDMIFQLDGRDPAVRNMLDAFFAELHRKGALRGAQAEDGYRLTNLSTMANLILYRIEIAPSFPVDRFVVTFMHDRAANTPNSQLEVSAHA